MDMRSGRSSVWATTGPPATRGPLDNHPPTRRPAVERGGRQIDSGQDAGHADPGVLLAQAMVPPPRPSALLTCKVADCRPMEAVASWR